LTWQIVSTCQVLWRRLLELKYDRSVSVSVSSALLSAACVAAVWVLTLMSTHFCPCPASECKAAPKQCLDLIVGTDFLLTDLSYACAFYRC